MFVLDFPVSYWNSLGIILNHGTTVAWPLVQSDLIKTLIVSTFTAILLGKQGQFLLEGRIFMTNYGFSRTKFSCQNECRTCDPLNQFIPEFDHLLWIIARIFFPTKVQSRRCCTVLNNFHKNLRIVEFSKKMSRWKVYVSIKTGWRDFIIQNLNYKVKRSGLNFSKFFLNCVQGSKMVIFDEIQIFESI